MRVYFMNEYLYVDTETTGLDFDEDELLSIAIIDSNGNTLFHEYVKPKHHESWEDAEKINNISPEDVANCPGVEFYAKTLTRIFKGRKIVAYNMEFDGNFLAPYLKKAKSLHCCMDRAKDYYQFDRWLKLTKAIEMSCPEFSYDAHNALADAQACRVLWQWLEQQEDKQYFENIKNKSVLGIIFYNLKNNFFKRKKKC